MNTWVPRYLISGPFSLVHFFGGLRGSSESCHPQATPTPILSESTKADLTFTGRLPGRNGKRAVPGAWKCVVIERCSCTVESGKTRMASIRVGAQSDKTCSWAVQNRPQVV